MNFQNSTEAGTEILEDGPPPYPGYRLLRLEVKNFGGYHGKASSFNFGAAGAVFSGDNGAGKSTAIDAWRMLFRTQPKFNSAATEKSNSRTVETYYLGQYGRRDTGNRSQAMELRAYGAKEGFMAVCGIFGTHDGRVFSIMRSVYYAAKGNPDWHLVTGPVDLSIERDFPVWQRPTEWRNAVKSLGGTPHDGYADFFASIAETFGLDTHGDAHSAAFRFMDESIGIKQMQSITDFARENIFPRISLQDTADTVIKAFDDIRKATEAVVRVEEKISSLRTITTLLLRYEEEIAKRTEAISRKARFGQFRSAMNIASSLRIQRRRRKEEGRLTEDIAEMDQRRRLAQVEIDTVNEIMRSKGVDDLPKLHQERQAFQLEVVRIEETLREMTVAHDALGLRFNAGTLADFESSALRLEKASAKFDVQIQEISAARDELLHAERDAHKQFKDAAETALALSKNKSSVEPALLRAREALQERLNIPRENLPFLAELAQVREEDVAWEGVANRVLGAISSEILIESRHAGVARAFINGRHWSARVVLREISDLAPTRRFPSAGSLAEKVEIKSKTLFSDVARVLIDGAAGHQCVGAEQFRSAQGDAVTVEGSIKKGNRIIKDDRHRIDDRSTYILGWDIRDRIRLAEERRDAEEKAWKKAKDELAQADKGIRHLTEKRTVAQRLIGRNLKFESVNADLIKAKLTHVSARISILESPETKALQARLDGARLAISEVGEQRDKAVADRGRAQETIGATRKSIESERRQLKDSRTKHGARSRLDRIEYRRLLGEMMSVPTADAVSCCLRDHEGALAPPMSDLQSRVEEANNIDRSIINRASAARVLANSFLDKFPDETTLLEAEAAFAKLEEPETFRRSELVRQEWYHRLANLEQDDLPRHRKTFEEHKAKFATDSIGTIKADANAYAERLKNMESGLNAILAKLVYDPMEKTRARLRIHPRTSNRHVEQFRGKLDHAVAMLMSPDTEAREEALLAVIDEIKQSDLKTAIDRREAILNLANWHEMDVEEFYVDENGDYRDQRRFYAGKDGASGGQGERLTMLLIGAAIAYTFGAHDHNRAGAGLRTIILDEAFMHGSEDMAAAAIDVLAAIGLQVIAATPEQKLEAFAGNTKIVFSISKKAEQIQVTESTYAQIEERIASIEKEFGEAPQ